MSETPRSGFESGSDPKAPLTPTPRARPRRRAALAAGLTGLALIAAIAAALRTTSRADRTALPAAEQGRLLLADLGCTSCHQPGSSFRAPELTQLVGRTRTLQSGATVVIDVAYLTRAIRAPKDDIVQGYQGTMPAYDERLSDSDLQLIIEAIK